MEDTYHLIDNKVDVLSHPRRRDQIHILTVDPILGADVEERIAADKRLRHCTVVRPRATGIRDTVEEIEQMAKDTVVSRLLILDLRRVTLAKLHRPFNAIVGYNRRDFNRLCYSVCIGDGPVTLFLDGNNLDLFVPFLSSHRVDYYPAVFFYDPFLHYEPSELETRGIDEDFVIPDTIPRRLVRHLRMNDNLKVERIRRFFRATEKDEETKKKRLRMLRRLYKRQLTEQFPDRKDQLRRWWSRNGMRLATEKMSLYPLFFEDWLSRLIRKARENASAKPADRHE